MFSGVIRLVRWFQQWVIPGTVILLFLVSAKVLAGSTIITAPPPGQVSTGNVYWNISELSGNDRYLPGYGGGLVVIKYAGSGANATKPAGADFVPSQATASDTLVMGFRGRGENSNLLITLPGLNCQMQSESGKTLMLSTHLRKYDVVDMSTTMEYGGGVWSAADSGKSIQNNTQGVTFIPGESVTTSFKSGGDISTVQLQENVLPGTYTINLPVQCESHAVAPGQTDGPLIRQLGATASATVIVVPRPTSCSVTPPGTIDFGPVYGNQNTVSLGNKVERISANCDVAAGSDDISKGMYLTFEPGSSGLYGNDSKKLGTSMNGIYITGGVDSSSSGCTNSGMQFNGQVLPDFKLKTLAEGTNTSYMDVYFSLCHDTSKPITSGALSSNAKVNVVVQ
ncbi:hypothetical protein IOW38_004123 [Salmonella enterica]|nr:hypothetical protein [Salmonella enterica]EGM2645623.1 hypothetical protein [Salmonella enterica]EGM2983562.1 hypothetical protein [Salmonella enterica]EJU6033234.1 hypothetical protein [Salmonella enterica]